MPSEQVEREEDFSTGDKALDEEEKVVRAQLAKLTTLEQKAGHGMHDAPAIRAGQGQDVSRIHRA